MAETFGSLAARIRAQDPLTPDELEKLIAHRVSEIVDLVFKDIVLGQDTIALRDAIKEKFGFCCEIAPAMSIYVNISAEPGQNDIPAFSTLPFEEAIAALMEKDFSAMEQQEVIGMVSNVINHGCKHFIDAVIFSNPELMKLFKRYMQVFGHQITAMVDPPVTLCSVQSKPPQRPSDPPPSGTFGNYL